MSQGVPSTSSLELKLRELDASHVEVSSVFYISIYIYSTVSKDREQCRRDTTEETRTT